MAFSSLNKVHSPVGGEPGEKKDSHSQHHAQSTIGSSSAAPTSSGNTEQRTAHASFNNSGFDGKKLLANDYM